MEGMNETQRFIWEIAKATLWITATMYVIAVVVDAVVRGQ